MPNVIEKCEPIWIERMHKFSAQFQFQFGAQFEIQKPHSKLKTKRETKECRDPKEENHVQLMLLICIYTLVKIVLWTSFRPNVISKHKNPLAIYTTLCAFILLEFERWLQAKIGNKSYKSWCVSDREDRHTERKGESTNEHVHTCIEFDFFRPLSIFLWLCFSAF